MRAMRIPLWRVAGIVFNMLLIVVVTAPLYWLILTALRPRGKEYEAPPNYLPTDLDAGGMSHVFQNTPLITWLSNSFIVAGSTTVLALTFGLPASYAVARLNSRLTRGAAGGVLLTQVTPPIVMLVPMFILFRTYGLIDSKLGLILADLTLVLPLVIWLGAAMVSQIPREIDEAAAIDGCSYWGAFFRTILPVLRPSTAAIAIYAFIEIWDEFLFARSLTTSQSNWTASIGLFSFKGADFVPINEVMFAALIFTVIPFVLFFLVRRALTASLTAGAVKG